MFKCNGENNETTNFFPVVYKEFTLLPNPSWSTVEPPPPPSHKDLSAQ